jgi:hypothetical protein
MRTFPPIVALAAVLGIGAVVWTRSRRSALAPHPPAARGHAIRTPVLGVLRLDAAAGRLWKTEDAPTLALLFNEVRESDRDIPRCDVLFIYGTLDAAGRFGGRNLALRDIIRDAGAKVVVVASPNPGPHYIAAAPKTGYGMANLVMVLDRKGSAFPSFFRQLFSSMFEGVPMPEAWTRMAPQVRGAPHPGLPDSIFACELGPLTFEHAAPRA